MKKNDVQIGGTYLAKVSDQVVPVRVDAENRQGGWNATNLMTGKTVRIKSAQRLRCPVDRNDSPQPHPKLPMDNPIPPDDPVATAPTAESPTDAPIIVPMESATAEAAPVESVEPPAPTTASPPAPTIEADAPSKKLSAIDAAARVLCEENRPINCQEMIDAMAAKGYWHSLGGKTPASTLYSSILREQKVHGDQTRFVKAGRGQFTLNR